MRVPCCCAALAYTNITIITPLTRTLQGRALERERRSCTIQLFDFARGQGWAASCMPIRLFSFSAHGSRDKDHVYQISVDGGRKGMAVATKPLGRHLLSAQARPLHRLLLSSSSGDIMAGAEGGHRASGTWYRLNGYYHRRHDHCVARTGFRRGSCLLLAHLSTF